MPHWKEQFWRIVWPTEKHSESVLCYGALRSEKSITATAGLRQPRAMVQTGRRNITLSSCEKSTPCPTPCNAAFRQNSLITADHLFIIRFEANIGITLGRNLAVFTRSAITPPK